MLSTSANFTSKFMSNDRLLDSYVVINGTTYDSTKIVDWTFHDTISFNDQFEIGTTIANTFEVTLMNVSGSSFDNVSVNPYVGIDIGGSKEYVTLGQFFVDNIQVQNISPTQKNIKLSCFDKMMKLDVPFTWTAGATDTIANIVSRISTITGVPKTGTYPTTSLNKIPDLYTCRQVLGFISAIMGGNGVIDRFGNIAVKKYISPSTTVLSIDGNHYYQDGLDRGTDTFTIGQIVGDDMKGNVYTNGTLTASNMMVTIENPFLTQTLVDGIGTLLNGLTYIPFRMSWIGNPALESGDNINITEVGNPSFNTVLMDNVITYPNFGIDSETKTEGKSTNNQRISDETKIIIDSKLSTKEDTVPKTDNAPSSPKTDSLWIDTSVIPNRIKRWNGSAWVNATPTVPADIGAIDTSTLNTELAKKESSITKSNTAPASPVTNQIWIDTSISPAVWKRYTGSAWEKIVRTDMNELTGQISASQVTTTVLNAVGVDATAIKSGTIDVNRLGAGSISADKLSVTAKESVNNFSRTGNLSNWTNNANFTFGTFPIAGNIRTGLNVGILNTNTDLQIYSDWFEVDPNKAYKVTMSIYHDYTLGSVFFGLHASSDGTNNNVNVIPFSTSSRTFSAETSNGYFHSVTKASTLSSSGNNNGWIDIEGYIVGENVDTSEMPAVSTGTIVSNFFKMKAGTKYIRLRFLNYHSSPNYGDGTTPTIAYYYNPSVTEIGTGIIHGDNIQANTITAGKINVSNLSSIQANIGTITAGRLQNALNTSFLDLTNNLLTLGSDKFVWNGTSLSLKGNITNTSSDATRTTTSTVSDGSFNQLWQSLTDRYTANVDGQMGFNVTHDTFGAPSWVNQETASYSSSAITLSSNNATNPYNGIVLYDYDPNRTNTVNTSKKRALMDFSNVTLRSKLISGTRTGVLDSWLFGGGLVLESNSNGTNTPSFGLGIFGIHMKNQDIRGCNSIVFNDATDTSSEGLMFPRGSTSGDDTNVNNFDGLRILNGRIIFDEGANTSAFTMGYASTETPHFSMSNDKSAGQFNILSAGASIEVSHTANVYIKNRARDTYVPINASAFTVNSQREMKHDIEDYTGDALEQILTTPIRQYHYKGDLESEPKRIGVILDESPIEIADIRGQGVETYSMVTMSWKAIQQLNDTIQKQNDTIQNLTDRLQILEEKINSLTN